MAWFILAIVGAAALLFMSRSADAREPATASSSPSPTLDELFAHYAQFLPPLPLNGAALLKAIARKESALNPLAVRNNPPNDVSVGLMQVLCIPDADGVCTNRFNVDGWPSTFDALKDPETNLQIAVQILSYNLKQYGFPKGIAVYNSYSARNDSANGPFRNQQYVDDVLRFAKEYQQ